VGHEDPSAFYQVNLLGTQNLLTALESGAPGVSSVLLASSANIYGNQKSGRLSEDTLPQPANDYAVSKYAMELMAGLRLSRLPIIIVRPFNYTGVGQDDSFLIPKIVNHFRRRAAVIELGNLEVWREFGDVRVVARAYRRLLEKRPTGSTLNVCTGQPHSLNDVVSTCERLTGHRMEVRVNPHFVRANEVRELYGDNARLMGVIDRLNNISLEDTLSWMLSAPAYDGPPV
jgi:nucleoside-diphosphate-sugar epimerase